MPHLRGGGGLLGGLLGGGLLGGLLGGGRQCGGALRGGALLRLRRSLLRGRLPRRLGLARLARLRLRRRVHGRHDLLEREGVSASVQ